MPAETYEEITLPPGMWSLPGLNNFWPSDTIYDIGAEDLFPSGVDNSWKFDSTRSAQQPGWGADGGFGTWH